MQSHRFAQIVYVTETSGFRLIKVVFDTPDHSNVSIENKVNMASETVYSDKNKLSTTVFSGFPYKMHSISAFLPLYAIVRYMQNSFECRQLFFKTLVFCQFSYYENHFSKFFSNAILHPVVANSPVRFD